MRFDRLVNPEFNVRSKLLFIETKFQESPSFNQGLIEILFERHKRTSDEFHAERKMKENKTPVDVSMRTRKAFAHSFTSPKPSKKKPGSTRSIQRDIPRERAALVAGLRPSDRFRRDRLKQTSSISTKRLEDMLGPSWFKKPGDLVKSGLDAAKQIALKVSITSFFPSLFFTLILTSLNFILNSIQISG